MYLECPERGESKAGVRGIFLAGGIVDCPDWQREIVGRFKKSLGAEENYVLFNPRRKNFPIDDPTAAPEQIMWEYDYFRMADAILFWFPRQTLCPIVLYELGAWSMTDKPIFVGVHPDYARRQDVEIQTELARPEVNIVYSLGGLVAQTVRWLSK